MRPYKIEFVLVAIGLLIFGGISLVRAYDYAISFGMHDCDRAGYCPPAG